MEVGFVGSSGWQVGRKLQAQKAPSCRRRAQVVAHAHKPVLPDDSFGKQGAETPLTRRDWLVNTVKVLPFVGGLFVNVNPAGAEEPGDGAGVVDLNVCQECQGTGMVTCDLCEGTGFWRATAIKDPKVRYKGVVCPTCDGTGEVMCLVCLGTGEADTGGMLRKRKVPTKDGRVLQS